MPAGTLSIEERARGVSRKIHKALFRAMEVLVVPQVGSCAMSVEMFLSALGCVYGKVFLRQFDDPGAFLRMQQELMPNRRGGLIQRFLNRSKMPFVSVRRDNQLRDLLWNATRIARAIGKQSADLPEVMASLCLDDKLVADLEKKWGFRPVQFLEKLPPGPDYLSSDNTPDAKPNGSHPAGNSESI